MFRIYQFKLHLFCALILFPFFINAQTEKKEKTKGYLYLTWGYNKDWYSTSDLHFRGSDYDFTLFDVKAKDNPSFDQILNNDLSIPQFIYRIGYIFGKHPNLGIELSFDHAKYIVIQNQVVKAKGTIREANINQDTVLTESFLRFEHTNGANFLMFSVFDRINIHTSLNKNHSFLWIVKPGAGIVIPQSSVALFNEAQDNNYHIAGYVMGLDMQLHYEYKHGFFFETGFKGVFANYTNVLCVGDVKANHHFTALEWLIGVGYQIKL